MSLSSERPSCSCTTRGHTPTQSSHTRRSNQPSSSHDPLPTTSTSSTVIYIVTDTCYPTKYSFNSNIGTTTVDSAHSLKSSANARAKKIIYENDGGCTVDIDKIIEELRQGLYTGIGLGGKEEKDGCCYARKCEVEGKIIDEDSEDEGSGDSAEGELDGIGDRDEKEQDGDVDMG